MFGDVIRDLLASGYTEAELAKAVHSTQATINRIKHGKQTPGFDLGVALLALRAQRCKPTEAA